MQYSISIDLRARTATIVRYQPGSLGPVRRETHHGLTGSSVRRLQRHCRQLTPIKIHRQIGFYLFARLGTQAVTQ